MMHLIFVFDLYVSDELPSTGYFLNSLTGSYVTNCRLVLSFLLPYQCLTWVRE